MWTITDPKHFPKYLKDSVLNTNKDFDYGSFLELEDDMDLKEAKGQTGTTLFAHTFNDAGSYFFADNINSAMLLCIVVVGAGETCADPDKYLQAISAGSLSANGVPMDSDIIIKLDYALLAAMAATLILFIAIIMVLIAYCLHKQWKVSKLRRSGYRLDNLNLDIRHTSDKLYAVKESDFARLPSHPRNESSGEEDDIDGINMDIYQDLVTAGEKLVSTFMDAKDA
jgi:hypothetical protein